MAQDEQEPKPAPNVMELLTKILYRLDEIESMLEDLEGKMADIDDLPYRGSCDD